MYVEHGSVLDVLVPEPDNAYKWPRYPLSDYLAKSEFRAWFGVGLVEDGQRVVGQGGIVPPARRHAPAYTISYLRRLYRCCRLY